jgi:excisionase family DNA binding protein
METDSLLTPAEVSHLLRISLSSVYAAAVTGRIPVVTLWRGRRKSLVRFRRADIEALTKTAIGAYQREARGAKEHGHDRRG